jgi:hypothetical protein
VRQRRRVTLETPSARATLFVRETSAAPVAPAAPRRSVRALVVAYTLVPVARLVRLVCVRPLAALVVRPLGAVARAAVACVPAGAWARAAGVGAWLASAVATAALVLSIAWATAAIALVGALARRLRSADGTPVLAAVGGVLARVQAYIDARRRRRDELIEAHVVELRRIDERARLGVCVVAVVLVVAGLVGVGLVLVSDARTAVVDVVGAPRYARDGEPHVNVTARSIAFTCHELRTGVLAVRGDDGFAQLTYAELLAAAQYALQHEPHVPCVCAPMFGKRRRHVALRLEAGGIMHLYNVERDVPPPDAPPPTFTRLNEQQRAMFPARTELVQNVRLDELYVRYDTETCARAALVVRRDPAWCVQKCLDLFDGISVYERARLREAVRSMSATTTTSSSSSLPLPAV